MAIVGIMDQPAGARASSTSCLVTGGGGPSEDGGASGGVSAYARAYETATTRASTELSAESRAAAKAREARCRTKPVAPAIYTRSVR